MNAAAVLLKNCLIDSLCRLCLKRCTQPEYMSHQNQSFGITPGLPLSEGNRGVVPASLVRSTNELTCSRSKYWLPNQLVRAKHAM